MSIWGKIVGGLAGFAIGGPLGGLVGAIGGHVWDRNRSSEGKAPTIDPWQQAEKQQALFGLALVALAAKMSKADGQVTADEIRRFRSIFHINEHNEQPVGRIFKQAQQSAEGFEAYAQQIHEVFADQPQVREMLLWCLVSIACADGHVHEREWVFLKRVAAIFALSDMILINIVESERQRSGATIDVDLGLGSAAASSGFKGDPYAVLGVSARASDQEVKRSYRKLVRDYHPDRLIAAGLPQDVIDVSTHKLAQINDAYDVIEKQRARRL